MRYFSRKGISPVPSIIMLTILIGTTYSWYIFHDKVVQAKKTFEDLKLNRSRKVGSVLNDIEELRRQVKTLQNLCGVGFEKQEKTFAGEVPEGDYKGEYKIDMEVGLPVDSALKWLDRVNKSNIVDGNIKEIKPKIPTIDDVTITPNRDATVEKFIIYFQNRISGLEKNLDDNNALLKEKEEALTRQRDAKQKDVQSRKDRIEQLLQDKIAAEKSLRDEVAALTQDRDSAREEKNEAKKELNAIKAEFRVKRTELENQLEEVVARVEKIKNPEEETLFSDKIETPPDAPDGQITFVDLENRVGYINIGLQSGVSVGQKFAVFRFGKRGVRYDIGEIEVKRVLEDMSLVAITEIKDPVLLMAPEDQIMNEVFDVTKTQYFSFAGRLVGRYSNEEVTKMIEEVGWKVTRNTDVRTSYIIIGKGYETHENYIDGLKYDIEILREVDILRILGKD